MPDAGAPGGERVKVLDFGIAKVRRGSGTGGTMRTQTGVIMGSPAYMSPEQCKDSADVDLRSDIYSFATIIYEVLAGRTPYVAASGTEMLIKHLTETPPPLQEFVADVPAQVEAAIMRALARARADRFESMEAFVGALRGDASETGLSRSSSSEELPAFRESPVPAPGRTVAVQSVTTFSRTTGEVGAATSDDVLLAAAQSRRWPVFAIGAVVVIGLVLFLLVRPSHDSALSRPPQGALAAVDAGVDGAVAPLGQEPPKDKVVAESGTVTVPVAAPRTDTRTHAHRHTTPKPSKVTPAAAGGDVIGF